jgi:8-oxo-dGTP diphosphatase
MRNHVPLIPAVYIYMHQADDILLIRRANTGYMDGKYAFPSGHIESSEAAKQAGIREAKEEVGVTITAGDLRFRHVLHRMADDADHERIDFFFEATSWQGDPYNAEPDKCDDVRWFALDALPDNLTPVTRHGLQMITAGELYSDVDF